MNNESIAKQIVEIIAPKSGVFGLRKTYDIGIGDDVPHSYDWDFENDCQSSDRLDGASTIALPEIFSDDDFDDVLNLVNKMEKYPGTKLILVSGDHAGFGDDNGELLISNGTVIMAW